MAAAMAADAAPDGSPGTRVCRCDAWARPSHPFPIKYTVHQPVPVCALSCAGITVISACMGLSGQLAISETRSRRKGLGGVQPQGSASGRQRQVRLSFPFPPSPSALSAAVFSTSVSVTLRSALLLLSPLPHDPIPCPTQGFREWRAEMEHCSSS